MGLYPDAPYNYDAVAQGLVFTSGTSFPRVWTAPSTLLGVSLLGYPNQLVQIEAIAALE